MDRQQDRKDGAFSRLNHAVDEAIMAKVGTVVVTTNDLNETLDRVRALEGTLRQMRPNTDFEDTDDCWDCGGEGGYASCPEDCCPHIYGEEGCDDPACWRRCATCRGTGFLGNEPLQDTSHDNS